MHPAGRSGAPDYSRAYESAKRFAESPNGWLVFVGPVGSGKTHLSCAIANALLSNGRPVFYVGAADLLDHLRAAFGPETGIFLLVVFVIGITSWMQTARIVRGDVLALKEREFVLAARSIGTPSWRITLRHILPNVLSPIMVSATLGVANAIITESALSFLGLGFPSDFPTWGRLLYDGANFMTLTPERVFWPGLAISLTVLSVNYIGDGLRDALDPRIRGR